MVWPTSCDGVAIGQGMVGRNCGQVNRSTTEERKELDDALRVLFTLMQRAACIVSAVFATILARGEHMDIIALLKAERDKVARQLNALDTAIKALSGLNSTGTIRGRRTMSAAARARISASQKARWARARSQKVVSIAPKRHISAAGLARIRAAQRARWAKIRKQQS